MGQTKVLLQLRDLQNNLLDGPDILLQEAYGSSPESIRPAADIKTVADGAYAVYGQTQAAQLFLGCPYGG